MLKKKLSPRRVQTTFKPFINSRHPSHAVLRDTLPNFPFRALIRLGSTKTLQEAYPSKTSEQLARVREINSIQGVKNSSSKLLMKQCFTRAQVKTADWWRFAQNSNTSSQFYKNSSSAMDDISELPFPIVAKSHYGSRGIGNTKHDNVESLQAFLRNNNPSNYIFEKFSTFSKEYRIHVTNNGCFYTCRKLLKNTAPEGTWQKHDDGNVAWVLEENEAFKKPSTWNLIVEDCIRAKNALSLDICSFDVMVQGSSKENPEWIIIESQSAPSFGSITGVKYKEEIIKLLNGL